MRERRIGRGRALMRSNTPNWTDHTGNGWFGGFLPATVFAIVSATGNIYSGLCYPIIIAAMSFVVALIFLPETKDRDITHM